MDFSMGIAEKRGSEEVRQTVKTIARTILGKPMRYTTTVVLVSEMINDLRNAVSNRYDKAGVQ